MDIVGIQGIHSGAGVTTVTAGLAVALNKAGLRTIALDGNDNNHLGLFFGSTLSFNEGLKTWDLLNQTIAENLLESEEGYPFIPMGFSEKRDLNQVSEQLSQWLAPLFHTPERILLVDMSFEFNPIHSWVYQQAKLIINVGQPEPRIIPSLKHFELTTRKTQLKHQLDTYILLNRVAPHLALNRDITDYLKGSLSKHSLIPSFILNDAHLSEAFAALQPVLSYEKHAQAVKDFDALALWLLTELA